MRGCDCVDMLTRQSFSYGSNSSDSKNPIELFIEQQQASSNSKGSSNSEGQSYTLPKHLKVQESSFITIRDEEIK